MARDPRQRVWQAPAIALAALAGAFVLICASTLRQDRSEVRTISTEGVVDIFCPFSLSCAQLSIASLPLRAIDFVEHAALMASCRFLLALSPCACE